MAAGVAALTSGARAQQPAAAVTVDADDIGGVVSGPKGPEAGVWVIAETSDLPTRFVKIVVTDDRGRYLLPDLPKASYSVWVRGYGLIDSAKVSSAPQDGQSRRPSRRTRSAAHYYPAGYWFSLTRPTRRSSPPPAQTVTASIRTCASRPIDPQPQVGRLSRVPSTRQQGDARDLERARRVPTTVAACGSGACSQGRPARRWPVR
jgi:hypothetical protein